MLDLQKIVKDYYEIKLADGTVLQLKNPSQKMLKKMYSLKDMQEDSIEVLDIILELVTYILNNNVNEYKTTIKEVSSTYDINICLAIVEDYMTKTMEHIVGE